MRKIIIAGVAVTAFASGVKAEDHGITLKLGGRIETMAGYRQQKGVYNKKAPSMIDATNAGAMLNKGAIVNDTKIHINVDGRINEDFTYGGLIWLHADTSRATNEERSIADKTMAYIQHNRIGRLEAGNYPGAGGIFEMDVTNIAKAAYGVDGYWSKWINDAAYINLPFQGYKLYETLAGYKYLITPNLPSNYSGNSYSDAPKVTFYTKPLTGVTVGVSYIPDLDSTGSISGVAPKNAGPVTEGRVGYRPTFKNIISGGIQYENKLCDISYKLSASGEIGEAKKYDTSLIRDLKAYEVGVNLGYQDFKFVASYGSWLKTATYKNKQSGTKQGSEYWTLGFAHDIGKFGYSLTYMQSRKAGGLEAIGNQVQKNSPYPDVKYNKFNNISLGAEYKVANGFLPYAEVSKFTFKDSSGLQNNHGYIFLSGLRIAF